MKILLADDEAPFRRILIEFLETARHVVVEVENGQRAFCQATTHEYDLLITDFNMPNWNGAKCIEALSVICPTLPVIVISGCTIDEVKDQLQSFNNVIDVLPKPCDYEKLLKTIGSIRPTAYANIQKLTRIVCTIGPSCDDVKILGQMIIAGMDVARMNFSHGSHESHKETLLKIREAESNWERSIAILQDLCGPKIRTGMVKDNGIELKNGSTIVIQREQIEGTSDRISTNAPEIISDIQSGDMILLDDGQFELMVEDNNDDEIVCRVIAGGILKSNKGINLPSSNLKMPSVTDKDKRDLQWGIDNNVDYVALSFVRHPDDVREIKEIIKNAGSRAKVIAKIEKPEGVENIDEIIDIADGIMIARGDMGVELRATKVPWIQKDIVRKCNRTGKLVITATQMLDSMINNNRPTRAEVTDVATAVLDGSDAVMLSGETASGIDSVNAVRTMSMIINEAERQPAYIELQKHNHLHVDDDPDPILSAAAAAHVSATMVVGFTDNDLISLSKIDRLKRTIFVTDSENRARHTGLYHGVSPILIELDMSLDDIVNVAIEDATRKGLLNTDEMVAVIAKNYSQNEHHQAGSLHLIKVPELSMTL